MMSNSGTEELRSYVDRVERLELAKDEILADIKSVYGEAKDAGFTVKILRKVVAERKKDPTTKGEEDELFDLYWGATTGELFDDVPQAMAPVVATAAKGVNKGRKATAKAKAVALQAAADFAADEAAGVATFGPDSFTEAV